MREKMSILNIGGHPKDVILYAGGTMAKHVSLGDRVCALTPTHGISTHLKAIDEYKMTQKLPDVDALIAERKQELAEAAAELGVTDVRFLGHDDEITLPDREIINQIADVIGETRPDIIITHWPYDSVPAHANATAMTLQAIVAAAGIRKARPYAPHTVSQVFYHIEPGMTDIEESLSQRVPTTFIDISDVIEKKKRALEKFDSQYLSQLGASRPNFEVLDLAAIHLRVRYAEGFVAKYPSVEDSLPLSKHARRINALSLKDIFTDLGT